MLDAPTEAGLQNLECPPQTVGVQDTNAYHLHSLNA